MSGDPEQDYFADGMVDDIITGLSRIKWLFVIARNSTFIYKCRAADVKQRGAATIMTPASWARSPCSPAKACGMRRRSRRLPRLSTKEAIAT